MLGRTFMVTGKLGRARRHHGFVGKCTWLSSFVDWTGAGNRNSRPPAQRMALDGWRDGKRTSVLVAVTQVTEVKWCGCSGDYCTNPDCNWPDGVPPCDKCECPNDRANHANYCTPCGAEFQSRIARDPETRPVGS